MDKYTDAAQKAIEHLKERFNAIKTGRAVPSLLDTVKVLAWGNLTPLNQVATISAPDHSMLLVKPFDKSMMKDIEEGIAKAGLGLNPINTGDELKIPIPTLTEETRTKYVKMAHEEAENTRKSIRIIRSEIMDDIKLQHKNKDLTDDDKEREESALQKKVDASNELIDSLVKDKEKQLLTI